MVSLQPFIRQNFATTPRFNRHKTYTPYRHKLRTKFYLPCLDIVNVWRGASEIVAKFFFETDETIALFSGTKAFISNFCPCITWRTGAEEIARYKLWQNVGEILYVPLYSGQIIPTGEFQIEIWNINAPIIYVGGETFDLPRLVNPICPVSSLGRFTPCVRDIAYIRNQDETIVLNEDGRPIPYIP